MELKIKGISEKTFSLGIDGYEYVFPSDFKAIGEGDILTIKNRSFSISANIACDRIVVDDVEMTEMQSAVDAINQITFSEGGGASYITPFGSNRFYSSGRAVSYAGSVWIAKGNFKSGDAFDAADWDKLSISVEEFVDGLEEKVDKTDEVEQIYGTDESGDQTTFDKSDFEFVENKTDEIRDATEATDDDYPTEKAARTELDKKVDKTDGKGKVYGTDEDGEQTTYGLSDFEFVENKVKEIRDVTKATDVDYPTERAVRTELDANVTAFNTALEPIAMEIQGLHGKTARLNGYDFGMSITSDNINDSDIQTILTAYALVQLGLSDAADIPNFIGVHNLYAGDGGDHLLVFNQAIVGSGTPDSPEFPAHWVDNGLDSVSVASSTSLGVVKGSETDMQVAVGLDGKMSVNGLGTALNKKVDKTDSPDKVYGTDEDGEQTTYGVNSFGKVDTVNGISPDTDKNVQTDYVYETEAAFEADKDNIPIGATVIKLYEYPDNFAGIMPVPDYDAMEGVNRITVKNGSWTADRTGYCRVNATMASGDWWDVNIGVLDNGVWIKGNTVLRHNGVVASGKEGERDVVAIAKGQTIQITSNGTLEGISCYFIPPLFVKV